MLAFHSTPQSLGLYDISTHVPNMIVYALSEMKNDADFFKGWHQEHDGRKSVVRSASSVKEGVLDTFDSPTSSDQCLGLESQYCITDKYLIKFGEKKTNVWIVDRDLEVTAGTRV